MKTCIWLFTLLAAGLLTSGLAAAEAGKGPLAEYVGQQDPSYQWVQRQQGKLGPATYVELTLTSQTWQQVVWKHQLFILRPSTVDPDTRHALLFVSGGNWSEQLEGPGEQTRLPREAQLFAAVAEQMKTPVAVLLHVPQQPMFDGKYEDQIIALTFEQFLKTGDPQWPLLLPMVKSVVRGMDAVQEFAQQQWKLNLETFTISGASKRGWTTWLTGAVDHRATALAPMVIDMLNMGVQMDHQRSSWGALSPQIRDYTERGLDRQLNSEPGKLLQAIVDPYSYRKLLMQPKLILIGTNDPYWPLDALNLYWDDLVGEKYILYVPNNGHGLSDLPRLAGSINALHQRAANGQRLPKLSWDFVSADNHLELQLQSDVPAGQVRAWVATSPTRDFRQAHWRSFPARPGQQGHVYQLARPEQGYAALFGEMVFDNGPLPFYLSTNVQIVNARDAQP